MSRYVAAFAMILLVLLLLQRGCERMRSARWDRMDERKDERKENREDRKDERQWGSADEDSDEGSRFWKRRKGRGR